jgi:DNA-directed RNA polymerase sigma subunit (sigma70/sigma32)
MTNDEQPSNQSITQDLLREDVAEIMAALSQDEKSVLRLRFGLTTESHLRPTIGHNDPSDRRPTL